MKTFTFDQFWAATNADRRALGQPELLFGDAQSAFQDYRMTLTSERQRAASLRVASFLPGRTVESPGDTPKTEPEHSAWVGDAGEANIRFAMFLESARADGWVRMDGQPASAVDAVIHFLERCGNVDIEEGVGQIFGFGTYEAQAAFREGIRRAIELDTP